MEDRELHLRNLFMKAQDGDEAAYRIFLIEVSHLLRGYLAKIMNPKSGSKEKVEDLMQDTLITIHRKRDLYDAKRPLLPWIYAVARYRFIDSHRADARRPQAIEWIEHLDFRTANEVQVRFSGEGKSLPLFSRLSEQQKEILHMAKVDEIPLKEIASHFRMSVAAVKVTIHRLIKNLRSQSEYEN